jgi:hypothetical protein
MILLDFSGVAIAPIVMGQAKYDDENLIRHMILNSIRMYRQKFKDYGEMLLLRMPGVTGVKTFIPNTRVSVNKTVTNPKSIGM